MNLVVVFGGVAFFTLLERKVLSYSQSRKGPKKVSFLGMVQPMTDAIKLLMKFFGSLLEVSSLEFFVFPLFSLLVMVSFWSVFTPKVSFYSLDSGILFLLIFFSLGVFPVLGSGWASKSKYSVLGAIRGAAQSMSYEVVLVFILIWALMVLLEKGSFFKGGVNLGVVFPCIFLVWGVVILCETNRAPFDFAEGESELVSGFKVEYGSFPFALLFLAEYGMILFLSVFSGFYFFPLWGSALVGWFISIVFLWVRSSFPRFRYDLLMGVCWGVFLPLTFVIVLILNLL